MNTQSQPYYLDEFPVLIGPGVSIGWLIDGIADLSVAWDDEQGAPYIDRVESITLAVDRLDDKGGSLESYSLPATHPMFKLIADEIMRRDYAGEIELEYDRSPDPDYLRDLREGDRIDAQLNGAR